MVPQSDNPGTFTTRIKSAESGHYKTFVQTLKELMEDGFIALPSLSSQWQKHIWNALNGDPFDLKIAMERWRRSLNPVANLESNHEIVSQWRQKQLEYILNVDKVLNFYLEITSKAFGD